MAQWQAAEAAQRFGDLMDAAATSGPQVVLRHDDAVAVVLSAEEYRRLVRQADANFAELLIQSPFGPGETEGVGMNLASGG